MTYHFAQRREVGFVRERQHDDGRPPQAAVRFLSSLHRTRGAASTIASAETACWASRRAAARLHIAATAAARCCSVTSEVRSKYSSSGSHRLAFFFDSTRCRFLRCATPGSLSTAASAGDKLRAVGERSGCKGGILLGESGGDADESLSTSAGAQTGALSRSLLPCSLRSWLSTSSTLRGEYSSGKIEFAPVLLRA